MVATRCLDDDGQEAWKQSILRAKNNLSEKASAPLVALLEGTSGNHHWTETNHPRPTFCNYCREKLNGVPWHGYTCDICKVKAHRKCRDNITEPCKWTHTSSIPQHLQFISPENTILPHQWMEGNLPMPSKCSVCEKPCGSVRKLVCQLAILPLGTGNDLARVLGWGHAFYDDTLLPQVVRTMERAHTKMLDRWSVLAIEGPQADAVRRYEELVIERVRTFLDAEKSSDIIHAATQLCTTIRELVHNVSHTYSNSEDAASSSSSSKHDQDEERQSSDTMTENCNTLLGKLDRLMKSLKEDANCLEESGFEPGDDDECSTGDEMKRRDTVVNRANSLKKALREVISMAERGIDQHYRDTSACTRRERFRKKRSKTTPVVLRISHSNLSSSSACSPPCSPIQESDVKEMRSSSCKATFEISRSQSTSSAVLSALFNSQSSRTFDEIEKPSIGTVHPPTPGGTREPSTAYDDDDDEALPDPPDVSQKPPETETPDEEDVNRTSSPDRPRIYSDTTLNKNPEKMKSQSLHPICSSVDKMKQSHSDSSLYGEYEGSSSGCAASGSTLSPARATDSTWARIKERKRTVGSDLGLSSSSQLRSCRNMLSGFAGGSLIAEILLLNARVLSQMARVHHQDDVENLQTTSDCQTPFTQYKEMCVMNNYFGIGLDAKIALEFHNKREESEKTRSRSKLFMWYGILGGKELMHRTYRNLEQRIKLECDGVPIDLPSLQGIVILNIPSYSGGANFWGRNKDGPEFTVQSFDDRILE
uniref:Diacylglycerol kinase eta n=1 Tax=Caenorhabditis japonica TaxID=281687 RepID=A0A8R1I5H0_CAEJA